MPHVSSASGGDDLGSTDEVKVFKHEEDGEDEKRSAENLTEEKSSLIDLTESEEKTGGNYATTKSATRPDHSPVFGKVEPTPHTSSFNMGYLVSPYSYANGAGGPIPVSMASKMGLAPTHPSSLPFFCHNGVGEHLSQPPPAHMGIPPYQLDAKAAGSMGEYWRANQAPTTTSHWRRLGSVIQGLSRPPMYPFSPGQYPYPMLSPEMSQVASWHTPSMYPIGASGGGFRSPYPTSLPISSSSLPGDFYRFSPTGLIPPHPGLSPHGPHPHALASHPAIVTPGPKQDLGPMQDNHHREHTPSMYPIGASGGGFRSPYPTSLPISSSSLPGDFYRFSPTGLIPPHPGLSPHGPHPHALASHPAIVTPGPKQDLGQMQDNHHRTVDQKNSSGDNKNNQDGSNSVDKKKPHIKKPLNAFMLYMKEMRAKVVAECTLKESAAINQILGRRWHSLSREEQAKYYEKARQERQLHMQLYPGWSARDNYGYGTKKKKRKKERTPVEPGGNSMKKCRARYGLDQQSQWCKPCRRKKKCIRYMESGDSNDGNQSDDNLGSCGSVGDAHTPPEDDTESLNQSLSSPGGLSGLSSLTSPSMILPSPSTSLASPSVSLASPCMSLQSPLTPHDGSAFDCKLPQMLQPQRNPVGTNPHDINNPLSVNQLTGQCVKNEPRGGDPQTNSKDSQRAVISVT